tara:strand:- start:384 stop:656 length:273 start_codon:yes stop_codon:yes gene_type:complete
MIREEIQKPPFIHFGLGKQNITKNAGESFKIYQKNVYRDEINFQINSINATYENTFTINVAGVYTYTGRIKDILAQQNFINGNTITITII